jgi:hypothetical protein
MSVHRNHRGVVTKLALVVGHGAVVRAQHRGVGIGRPHTSDDQPTHDGSVDVAFRNKNG